MKEQSRTHRTLEYLRNCRYLRASGGDVCYIHDPAWLVNMAVNRRAGWPDDPTHSRGNCRPVLRNGLRVYPPKASGDAYRHLCQLSHKINTPRVIVRTSELGEWRNLLLTRIPNRFHSMEDC